MLHQYRLLGKTENVLFCCFCLFMHLTGLWPWPRAWSQWTQDLVGTLPNWLSANTMHTVPVKEVVLFIKISGGGMLCSCFLNNLSKEMFSCGRACVIVPQQKDWLDWQLAKYEKPRSQYYVPPKTPVGVLSMKLATRKNKRNTKNFIGLYYKLHWCYMYVTHPRLVRRQLRID